MLLLPGGAEPRRRLPLLLTAAGWLAVSATGHAADPRHEGVASCASTTCHGAARPLNGTAVLQNEYVTWSEFDPHARAYRTLRDERSAAIARRLGLGPAEQAGTCLVCHAEVVPAADRGPRFQPDDGIGCEACHGAAGKWLPGHDDGTADARSRSLREGLRALNEPVVRAGVCIACHVGGGDRLATHAMLAAGHPRLSFELDTFTELWRTSGGREHFRRDADYTARKPGADSAVVWLSGLVEASVTAVTQVQAAVSRGALPEFAAFNCYSCHRNMGLARWRDRAPMPGITPGALRVNDSALRLLATALPAWEPERSAGLVRHLAGLQRAANDDRSAVAPAADAIRTQLAGVGVALKESPPLVAERNAMLAAVLRASGTGAYPDYATAEQAAMAVVILLADTGASSHRKRDIDDLFQALDDDATFDQARFARILKRLNPAEPPRR